MKDERAYDNYQGAVVNWRFIKDLSLTEAVYAPKLELPKHTHNHSGFCLILQGRYTESYGKKLLECKLSDVKFHPAGEAHSDVYGSEGVRSFIVELSSQWLGRMGATPLIGSRPLVYRNSSLAWLMMRLRAELHSVDDETPLVVNGLLLELIAETSRIRRRSPANKPPRWLQQAKEFLDEQFSHSLSLSHIATIAGVHPIHLANSFRRYYHMSVGEYLRRRRVEFACNKISTSKDSLVDIALAAGFSNQSHFSRIFKQLTGMTPARYRAERRLS